MKNIIKKVTIVKIIDITIDNNKKLEKNWFFLKLKKNLINFYIFYFKKSFL